MGGYKVFALPSAKSSCQKEADFACGNWNPKREEQINIYGEYGKEAYDIGYILGFFSFLVFGGSESYTLFSYFYYFHFCYGCSQGYHGNFQEIHTFSLSLTRRIVQMCLLGDHVKYPH